MKKTLFTIAFLMTMVLSASAQSDAFFKWTNADNDSYRNIEENNTQFALPNSHGYEYDSAAPLGTGLLILTALGAGYVIKRRKK